MALSVSGEFEIEAPQEQVMAALADVERIPEWSVVHKKVVVESRFDDGRPRTVRMTLAVLGVADTQLAEHKCSGTSRCRGRSSRARSRSARRGSIG